MHLLRQIISLFIAILFSLHISAEVGRLFTSDKISSLLISSIVQDKNGYVWVGTQNGLNRFDGYGFTEYKHREGVVNTLKHNNITTLFVDRGGRLLVGTPKGLSCYDGGTDAFVSLGMAGSQDFQPRITRMAQRRNGNILIGTSGYGLFELPVNGKTANHCKRYCNGGTDDYYPAIHVDTKGRFWKGDNVGRIFCYSDNGKLLLKVQPGYGLPIAILDDNAGGVFVVCRNGVVGFSNVLRKSLGISAAPHVISSAVNTHSYGLLLGTDHGLKKVDVKSLALETVPMKSGDLDFLTVNISSLLEDGQRNLWLGMPGRGLLLKSHWQQGFVNWSFRDQGIRVGSTISSLAKAADGGLWVSLRGNRLFHFSSDGQIDRSLSAPKGLSVVYRDKLGRLWVGAGTSLYGMDEATGNMSLRKNVDCDFISCITDDGHGTLCVSAFGNGIVLYDTKTGSVRRHSMMDTEKSNGTLCNDWVFFTLYDHAGLLWLATSSGVSCYDPKKESFKVYGWQNVMDGYACLSLSEDKDGNILIGTDRGLFRFDRKKNKVHPFPESGEMGDKTIYAVTTQPDGDVWCSSSMGIWHYRASDGRLVGHINDNGLYEREFVENVLQRLNDGRIVFGNSVSLVVFDPKSVSANVKKPSGVFLTKMIVGGQTVNCSTFSGNKKIIKQPISESRHFTLEYADNSFAMEFSNFDFCDAANLTLEYRLNGDKWSRNQRGVNSITFNHLQSGSYKLQVRVDENGQYSSVQEYTIVIRAPWYRSLVAYIMYVLVIVGVTCYVIVRYRRRQKLQLEEEKMQLLINATHDIRTPLTLILSPLHQLMRRKDNDEEMMEKLGIIDHNSRRILNLVNQILDIRKIDKQQMRLQCQETDLVPFIENIFKVFESHAQERNINFVFSHPKELKAWIDRAGFDKVVQNLLSNAFKFTPDGGEVAISLKEGSDDALLPDKMSLGGKYGAGNFTLCVTDTGVGLRESDIPKLFNRFYQSVSNLAQGKDGTGIGLNLCKKIVEMHQGYIMARNRDDGAQGSLFVVTVPLGKEHLKHEDLKPILSDLKKVDGSAQDSRQKVSNGKRPHILLVDDDAEITDYIHSELSAFYNFHSCQNGKEALHELLSENGDYDLVVSDIMMPEMDGFTLLRTIKSNPLLSHIPVFLLTSEAAVGNRLEGLQHGADAFLAKPFLIDELRATIDNVLAKAVRMKDRFSGAEEERKEQVEQRDVADNDKQLMDRVMQSINKNLDNSDYSVEQMADEVGLSRSQLHRKMKALTGITPSDFLRNLRLEQAARLLRERKSNVSQVAYSVGFNSLGNFSKAFKQHFGMPPTEYASSASE